MTFYYTAPTPIRIRSRRWLYLVVGIAIVAVAVLAIVVLAVFRHPKQQQQQASSSKPVILLPGTLRPEPSVVIVSTVEDLTVPIHSWVRKGQVIGQTAATADPESEGRIAAAIRTLTDADASLAEAEEGLRSIQSDGTTAAGCDYPQVASKISTGGAAESAPETGIAEQVARERVTAARRNRNAAERFLQQTRKAAGAKPVVAPADGLLVAVGIEAGHYGIAVDAKREAVWVTAPADMVTGRQMRIHHGQPVTVVAGGNDTTWLKGSVAEISDLPNPSSQNPGYPIKILVDNPSGDWITNALVNVEIETESPK